MAFLDYATDVVEMLRDGAGWDTEYDRDVWRLHKLPGLKTNPTGAARPRHQLRFDRIAQPWLKDLAKRWIRLRLSSGHSVHTVVGNALAITRFSQFLTTTPEITGLAEVDRAVLERYLAWLASHGWSAHRRSTAIGGLHTLLTAIRRYGWDTALSATAMFYSEDYPPRPARVDRHLAEHVMAQLEESPQDRKGRPLSTSSDPR